MVRRIGRLLALLAMLVMAPLDGRADQNDPALEPLFTQLKDADAVQGQALEEQIWAIWLQHPDRIAASLLDEGVVLMSRRRWTEALALFDQLVVRAPAFAEAWNKRATVYFLLGDFDRSVQDIQRTLILEPRHFGALAGLGQMYLQLDQPEAALRSFGAALKINPNMPGVQRMAEDLRARLRGSDI